MISIQILALTSLLFPPPTWLSVPVRQVLDSLHRSPNNCYLFFTVSASPVPVGQNTKKVTTKYDQLDVSTNYLPVLVNHVLIERTFEIAQSLGPGFPVLSVITGTKPDFYKQAPLLAEAVKQNVPVFVIDTGQHYDELLGHGVSEFGID